MAKKEEIIVNEALVERLYEAFLPVVKDQSDRFEDTRTSAHLLRALARKAVQYLDAGEAETYEQVVERIRLSRGRLGEKKF